MNDEAPHLNSSPNSGHTDKVKMSALASEAFDFTLANWHVLSKLAFLPFTASFAVYFIRNSFAETSWVYLLSPVVDSCAMGMFAVAVHRFYILGEMPKIAFGMQELKFIIFAFSTTALWLVPLEFTIFVFRQSVEAMHTNTATSPGNVLGSFACVAVLFYVALRLSLVFPLIAISEPGTFIMYIKYSWQKMRGNVLAFVISAFVLSFVTAILTGLPLVILIAVSAGVGGSFVVELLATGLLLVAGFSISLFLVLFASYIYKMTK